MEHELTALKLKLENGTLDENDFYCVEDALPWTLNMENRLGLSSLNLLLLEGYSNCDNRSSFDTQGRGFAGLWKELVSSIMSIIGKEVLETEENPSH